MSKTFVTSDTHFGHVNIIRYTNRPFCNVSHMNAHMINTWNSRVSAEDTVFFLGDFAMGPGVDPDYVRTILQMLNGNIVMLLGNHDMPSKWSVGMFATLAAINVKEVKILDTQVSELLHDGTKFVLSHFPPINIDQRVVYLHGHLHTQYTDDTRLENRNVYDVGVDMYGGPVELTGDCRYLKTPKGWKSLLK